VPRYSEQEVREAVAASFSYAEALRRLELRATGANWRTLREWVATWEIQVDHFDSDIARRQALRRRIPRPLEEILVEGSTYSRNHLKDRLYAAGLKQPICELCGQGELWRDRRMALILDHVNGVRDDNRLENLRIVCPNCAATLETHCGRKNLECADRECLHCGTPFQPKYPRHRYCSRGCAMRSPRPARGVPRPERRRVERPPYDELLREVADVGWSAVGRRYGVSDNAIRKWVRQYERERERRPP
jgi:hypothetical protein